MSNSELKQFIKLSRAIGRRPDFVQGAGGNISVKINNQKMLIKASGWRLAEIKENNGLVEVDYNAIKNSGNFIFKESQNLRPSIETGFHIFLDKFVIHTHSVYVNIIACAVDGEKLSADIFKNSGILITWVDYYNPGVPLALAIKSAIEKYENSFGKKPEAVLMKNHGLIVSGDDVKNVFELHNKIQEIIKQGLSLKKKFPQNAAEYLKEFMKTNMDLIENFSGNILFPDQAVFCNNIGEKILINKANGDIVYKTNQKEALTMEENLIAWAYIIDCARDLKLFLDPISKDDIDYINNMESEKYRQQLLKK